MTIRSREFSMRIVLSLVSALFLAASAASSFADDRRALVIGNANYPDADAPLAASIDDARSLAAELGRDGFVVTLKENLGGEEMRRALDDFYASIDKGAAALIFFGGIGLQSNHESYLVPIDAQVWAEADVRKSGISLEAVLRKIQARGASLEVALIDAGRRNPYERRFRDAPAGLSPVTAPRNTLVMYSTAPNELVEDRNQGLFVAELLKEMQIPGVSAGEALYRTQVGVNNATHGQQVPWISSTMVGAFSFVPGGTLAPASVTPPGAPIARQPPLDTSGHGMPTRPQPPAPPLADIVPFLPHQADYDLRLVMSRGSTAINRVRGNLLYTFSGSACDGYTTEFHQVSRLEAGTQGKLTVSDLRTTSWEEGAGKSYRFRIESRTNDTAAPVVDGVAERSGDSIVVKLKQPQAKTFSIDGSIVFPTEQVRRIIAAAKRGETSLEVKVYDGSDNGEKVYNSVTAIGPQIRSDTAVASADPSTTSMQTKSLPRWPVQVSYYDLTAKEGGLRPVYVMSFELFENGVSRALMLDYTDFVIGAALDKLDVRDIKPCK
jgi:hypothetical protein